MNVLAARQLVSRVEFMGKTVENICTQAHAYSGEQGYLLYQYVMVYTYCSGELMSSIGSLLVLEGSDEPHCAGGF